MGELVIKGVNETLWKQLELRARQHGRSIDDEALALLETATGTATQAGAENIAQAARRIFAAANGFDLALPPRGSAPVKEPPALAD